jgi:GDP-mannose 6-dehydrogenase
MIAPVTTSICVCGLGYVGAVTAAAFARLGYTVTGVDVDSYKVDAINAGQSPFVEKGLPELTAEVVRAGRLRATTDIDAAVRDADVALICVGTPSRPDGSLNLDFVRTVCGQIGEVLRASPRYRVVVVRSTILPGVTLGTVVPVVEAASGLKAGPDFGVAFNPEFLREGSAIEDFFEPTRTVIGELDTRSGDGVAALYDGVPGAVVRMTCAAAELVKYADNAWHAVKVSFANEIGSLAKALDVDGAAIMETFTMDTKLNISPKYLRPGLTFGGSCLPKDVRAINHMASTTGVRAPLLGAVLASNEAHLERILQVIRGTGAGRVGFLGVTFKPGTDDLRESPALSLIVALLADGIDVTAYDESLAVTKLVGANRRFLEQRVPDFGKRFAESPEALCRSVDAVVLAHDTPRYRAALAGTDDVTVVDCVGAGRSAPQRAGYEGVCW